MPPPMPKFDAPLLLEPEFKRKTWGRKDLEPLYGPAGSSFRSAGHSGDQQLEHIGEAWLTGVNSRFLTGTVAGLALGEVYERWPTQLCGALWKGREFPFLAKFIFTDDWLSMQVHPDDSYAALHENSRGKTEAWYIIKFEADSALAVALRDGIEREELAAASRANRSRELANLLNPKPGQTIFVPAGTVHALGPGLVLFEVSETSDVTYRLDDYGRRDEKGRLRQLHLERGLEVAKLQLPARSNLPTIDFREPFGSRRIALACPFFAIEILDVTTYAHFVSSPERVEALAIISGEGRVENASGWMSYGPGQTWLVPPAASWYRLAPEEPSRMIRFYVPDLELDIRQPLHQRGVPPELISAVVFDHSSSADNQLIVIAED
jgi:mannose-6-phosphate isomerase